MSEPDNNRVQELFLAALEMPVEQRDAWLIDQCGAHEELLSEVRALLEHDTPDDDPLEKGLDEALDVIPNRLVPDKPAGDEPSESDVAQVDSEYFLSKLSEVGVLSPTEIEALNQTIASGQSSANPRQIASQLVTQGKLTDYQASALLKGQPDLLIDKYLILDLLDAGGMGMVFKAIHRPMNRTVAVKMIAQHLLASPDQVKRFQREVRVAATLEHPNIVRSYDADQTRGVHFLVMEYVRGENLSNMIKRQGPMSVEQAIDCIRQAAQGLRYAQKQGVIHRDIKPANLMLDNDGLVKVLDLGLANIDETFRLAQQSSITGDQDSPTAQSLAGSELTTAGTVLGTVSFMAPEQSLDAHTADTRSDIYSLGCSLYYLLVGEAPYHGETIFQVFMQHREGAIPTLREQRPDVSEKVEAVCRKMLAKTPKDRYQSMSELLAGIEDCDIAPPPEKVSQSVGERRAKSPVSPTIAMASQQSTTLQQPKSRGLLGWLSAAIVLLALGGGYLWWQSNANQDKQQTSVAGNPPIESRSEIEAPHEPSAADLLATGEYEWRVLERLPEPINSKAGELGAHMTADGLTIVFASQREQGSFGAHDLWTCRRASVDNRWSDPINLGDQINSDKHETAPVLSPDGLRLYFQRVGDGSFVSTRDSLESTWSQAAPYESGSFGTPWSTSDGLAMVYSSLKGTGSRDLWIKRRASRSAPWPDATRLESPVNSDGDESHPTLSDDGRLLIFDRGTETNDPRVGKLWMATRTDWHAPWSKPVPIDSLNAGTLDRTPRLLADGKTFLFDSWRNREHGDIYLARLVRKNHTATPPSHSKVFQPSTLRGYTPTDWRDAGDMEDAVNNRGGKRDAEGWIDLTPLLDPQIDSAVGIWKLKDSQLVVEPRKAARYQLPVAVDGSYELKVGFTRIAGANSINLLLPIGNSRCVVLFDGFSSGGYSGLSDIDGMHVGPNSNNPTIVYRLGLLKTGVRQEAVVTVRIAGDNVRVQVALDGEELIDWSGPQKSLRPRREQTTIHEDAIGLLAWECKVQFDEIKLRILDGNARHLEPSAADLLATGEYEWGAAEKLPEPINSHVDEHSAHMTADGLTIVFSSLRKGGYGKPDLWMSTRETTDSDWSKPTNLGENINSKIIERDPNISEDLKTIVFRRSDEHGAQSFISRRTSLDAEWSTPEPFEVRGQSLYWFHITSDGLTIVFPEGVGNGNHDLFIGRRATQEEPWTEFASMGVPINTDGSERYCSISDDGRILIFERKAGGGEWWMATRSGWTESWSLPVRLDSFDDEVKPESLRLSPDGKSLLFALDRKGTSSNLDLYTSKLVRKTKLPSKTSDSKNRPSETPPKSVPSKKN